LPGLVYHGVEEYMPRKLRELRADLYQAGFGIDHQTGSHQVWKHPLLPGISANLAGKDGADAKSYQESQVRAALKALEAQEKM
jgi:predicted RNA binding protein YcfA (HicA-like mRNA interferase family)